MALILRGRVRDTSTTTGTGSITVSGAAISTYRTFSAVMVATDTIWAAIINRAANEWEVGLYTYASANTLSRVAGNVFDGTAGAGALVNFSAGTKDVFVITPISTYWTQITQAAYNALSPPNPNTLYVIVG